MSLPSSPPPRLRFSLSQVMLAVVVAALLCAVTMRAGTTLGPQGLQVLQNLSVLSGLALGALVVLLIVHSLVENLFGVTCPNCFQATLVRVALHSFGYRYYRCKTCGWRCKRRPWTTWEDVFDPEDDVFYLAKDVGGPPGLVPGHDDEDEAFWTGTTGALLRNQRGRKSGPGDPADPQNDPAPGPDQAGSS
jgi:predicted RNA-binding Zn-ribbon protein involved in translation (DUF1610 family)